MPSSRAAAAKPPRLAVSEKASKDCRPCIDCGTYFLNLMPSPPLLLCRLRRNTDGVRGAAGANPNHIAARSHHVRRSANPPEPRADPRPRPRHLGRPGRRPRANLDLGARPCSPAPRRRRIGTIATKSCCARAAAANCTSRARCTGSPPAAPSCCRAAGCTRFFNVGTEPLEVIGIFGARTPVGTFLPNGEALRGAVAHLSRWPTGSTERRRGDVRMRSRASPPRLPTQCSVRMPLAAARARSSNSARSRSLRVIPAARSNSAPASARRPSLASRSPRTLGSRW